MFGCLSSPKDAILQPHANADLLAQAAIERHQYSLFSADPEGTVLPGAEAPLMPIERIRIDCGITSLKGLSIHSRGTPEWQAVARYNQQVLRACRTFQKDF